MDTGNFEVRTLALAVHSSAPFGLGNSDSADSFVLESSSLVDNSEELEDFDSSGNRPDVEGCNFVIRVWNTALCFLGDRNEGTEDLPAVSCPGILYLGTRVGPREGNFE